MIERLRFEVSRKPKAYWLGATALLIVLGMAMVLYQTRLGAGASGDSVHYVMGAENLLAGNGYSRTSGGGEVEPIAQFPPFYSITLALLGLTGADLFDVARLFNVLLFGMNILIVNFLIHRYTRSIVTAVFGSLFILVSVTILGFHSWIMSEALYIFLSLCAIYGLARYHDTGSIRLLVSSGIVVSLATLTRYVGVSLAATGILSILIFQDTPWRRRLYHSLLLGGTSLVPFYLWLRRNASVTGTLANRVLVYHPIREELVNVYLDAFVNWFFARKIIPWRPRLLLSGLIATMGPVAFMIRDLNSRLVAKNRNGRRLWSLPWLLIFYLLGYLVILLANSFLLDAGTTLGAPERYLAPAYVATVVLVFMTYHQWFEHPKMQLIVRASVMIIGVVLLTLHVGEAMALFEEPGLNLGYVGSRLNHPEIVKEIERIHPSNPIISNNPELVFVLAGRPAYMSPIKYDTSSTQVREDFPVQIESARQKLLEGGRLIIFGNPDSVELEIIESLEVVRMDAYNGTTFYGYPDVLID